MTEPRIRLGRHLDGSGDVYIPILDDMDLAAAEERRRGNRGRRRRR